MHLNKRGVNGREIKEESVFNIAKCTKYGVQPDVVELVSLDKMPLPLPPGESEKLQTLNSARPVANDGYSFADHRPEVVKGFYAQVDLAKANLNKQRGQDVRAAESVSRTDSRDHKQGQVERTPEVHNDLTKMRIRFKPKTLGRAKFIAAPCSGTMIDDAWTGVDRFFDMDGTGTIRLSEVDLGATGGKFYMIKEAVNTQVRGKPAIPRVFSDDEGKTVEELVWVEGSKFYMLTFGPEVVQNSRAKAAAHVSAATLAQELF